MKISNDSTAAMPPTRLITEDMAEFYDGMLTLWPKVVRMCIHANCVLCAAPSEGSPTE